MPSYIALIHLCACIVRVRPHDAGTLRLCFKCTMLIQLITRPTQGKKKNCNRIMCPHLKPYLQVFSIDKQICCWLICIHGTKPFLSDYSVTMHYFTKQNAPCVYILSIVCFVLTGPLQYKNQALKRNAQNTLQVKGVEIKSVCWRMALPSGAIFQQQETAFYKKLHFKMHLSVLLHNKHWIVQYTNCKMWLTNWIYSNKKNKKCKLGFTSSNNIYKVELSRSAPHLMMYSCSQCI